MKYSARRVLSLLGRLFAMAMFSFACFPNSLAAADRQQVPINRLGLPVRDGHGHRINYGPKDLGVSPVAPREVPRANAREAASEVKANRFVAASGVPQSFWQYAVFGSGIGASNIVIGPMPASGGAREILVGGSSPPLFYEDNFWQALRYNATTGNYDQIFVSPLYSADDYSLTVKRIGIGNVIGDSKPEIVVMLNRGDIYLYDFATKTELGKIETGISDLEGLSLTDLDGDGRAEFIVTTANDLLVFNASGQLMWQVPGAGGHDVVVGQMDDDPVLEIAGTNGQVVDCGTHSVQWTRNGGFGIRLRLAPFPGENYQQLIVAEEWQHVYAYDVARKLQRWSINTPQDNAAIQVADVSGDAIPEVIIGDGQWGTIHVHDLITQQQKWAIENPEHGVTNIAVGDVDGDGVSDVLWGAGWTATTPDYLYIAETTKTHGIKWRSPNLDGPFLGPAIGDLDGDGQPELVICSAFAKSYDESGRILVFDLATLKLRGMSLPVVDNRAWTGVRDLKLRDVDANGRMEIVIGADDSYDGVAEIYRFDSSNNFTRIWANTIHPVSSPFSVVEVADLDNNGTSEIIAGVDDYATDSPGVYVYIYDYPSAANPWTSANMASDLSSVTDLIVEDLDGNGSKEIAALIATGDLYTFDGPTRELRNIRQRTGFSTLSNRSSVSGLVAGDHGGGGHFLQYGDNGYVETLGYQFASGDFNGFNVLADGGLWTGVGSVLNLRLPPAYGGIAWQSPSVTRGFGRFVATSVRNGQTCVFSSGQHSVVGFIYTPSNPTPTVATPFIFPDGGTFKKRLQVSLSCRTPGANIYYTLDGSDPTASSILYDTAPFKVRGRGLHIVKARAIASGYSDSAVASAVFTISGKKRSRGHR